MASYARDNYAAVFERSTAVFLARVAFADGVLVKPSDIVSATYTIQRRGCDDASAVVAGHDGVAFDPAAALYATLQTDPPWDADATGYNFRFEPDTSTDPAFPNPGEVCEVRFELSPTTGAPIVFRFQVEVL